MRIVLIDIVKGVLCGYGCVAFERNGVELRCDVLRLHSELLIDRRVDRGVEIM